MFFPRIVRCHLLASSEEEDGSAGTCTGSHAGRGARAGRAARRRSRTGPRRLAGFGLGRVGIAVRIRVRQIQDGTPPAFVASKLDSDAGVLTITFSETIDAASIVPAKIHVRESGNYSGGTTLTAGRVCHCRRRRHDLVCPH